MKKKIYLIYSSSAISFLFLVLSLFFELNFLIPFFFFFSLFLFLQFYTLLKYISRIEMKLSAKNKHNDAYNKMTNEESAQKHPIIVAAKKRLEEKL
tara:strand:- start:517 stop:804 length:288 start_codon:yes stop_codon:yes gene_type:complete